MKAAPGTLKLRWTLPSASRRTLASSWAKASSISSHPTSRRKPDLAISNSAAKYEFFESDEHETILSLGAGVEVGGTGNKRVDADSFTTWAPGLFFGKGFGDLPDTVSFLSRLPSPGMIGVAIPTSASTRTVTLNETTGERDIDIERHPDVLEWGFALEYSVIYLQEQVKDIGLHAPFDRSFRWSNLLLKHRLTVARKD